MTEAIENNDDWSDTEPSSNREPYDHGTPISSVEPEPELEADPGVEATGDTTEQAIENALSELGLSRENAAIEIISESVPAVEGESVSGAKARVWVGPLDEVTAKGHKILHQLLVHMNIAAKIAIRRVSGEGGVGPAPMVLDVSGDDLGLLIGWRGETLRSLQTLLNLMLGEAAQGARRLILDVERYRARREEHVRELALRLAQRVKQSGQRYWLEPMHAYERRAVHLALAKDEDVRTESAGKDPERRIIINPTGPAQGGSEESWNGGRGSRDRGQHYGSDGGRRRY